MLDAVFETPRLSASRILLASTVFIALCFFGLLNFGIVFGVSIWPLPIIWILAAIQKSPPDYRLVIWVFILGLLQDWIFGTVLGTFGGTALIAMVFLFGFNRFSPIVPTSFVNRSILSAFSYLIGLLVFGILIGNVPNVFGLIVPYIVTVALSIIVSTFFELEKGANNER